MSINQLLHDRLTVADEHGATMAEYGLMVTLVAAVVAIAVGPFGTAVAGLFTAAVGALP